MNSSNFLSYSSLIFTSHPPLAKTSFKLDIEVGWCHPQSSPSEDTIQGGGEWMLGQNG